ncbi:MAG TPA: lipid-A-disaccharide synthase [Gemmataceae bacterium]|nr:lipid-A-disaccharide synthase [Gemmataceae bacterium]
MRLFVSAGEPSGDLHGANLIHALRQREPGLEIHGFGGERMAAAGCNLAFPLCDMALVGIFRVLVNVPKFWHILGLADRVFREKRPDALVLIDFPGFHWWLARRARAYGIPVLYFVPPQIWGWLTYRVHKLRRLTDRVLCTLPFEEEWYRQRNVAAEYIGHPFFDELREQRLDNVFIAGQRGRPGTIVALLPGSRDQELHYNLSSLLRAAALIHVRRPDARFLVACLRDQQRRQVEERLSSLELPIEVHAGRTPEIIHLAHCCLAVSGSVSLELLYRGKPSAILYRHNWTGIALAHLLKSVRYITLVNLLADKELFPEYFGRSCPAEALADHALRWLNDRSAYEALCGELAVLRERVAVPGACDRAAEAVLGMMRQQGPGRPLAA